MTVALNKKVMENDEPSLEGALIEFESLKKPPVDIHKYQSAQRIGASLLMSKNFPLALRVCLLLEQWLDKGKPHKNVPKISLLKVEVWALLNALDCFLHLENAPSQTNVILTRSQYFLSVLVRSQSVLDPNTLLSACTKFRTLLWHTKNISVEVQLVVFDLLLKFEVLLEDFAPYFSKLFPLLVQKLRVNKIPSNNEELTGKIENVAKRLNVSLTFDYALWLPEGQARCSLLCTWAVSKSQCLFAAHQCDVNREWESASRMIVRGLCNNGTERDDDMDKKLVLFHVKNLSFQKRTEVKLLVQQVECIPLAVLSQEFSLFSQANKLALYVDHHSDTFPLNTYFHAKALRVLQHSRALDILRCSGKKNPDLQEVFLECVLMRELGLDPIQQVQHLLRLKPAECNSEEDMLRFKEISSWLWLNGYYSTSLLFYIHPQWKMPCSTRALALETHGSFDVATKQILLQLGKTKPNNVDTEFQSTRQVLEDFHTLGELFQFRGQSTKARYFYNKALDLARARKFTGGEVQRIQERLSVLSSLERDSNTPSVETCCYNDDDDDEVRQHFSRLFLFESMHEDYPRSVQSKLLPEGSIETAKMLFAQSSFEECVAALQNAPIQETLRAHAQLELNESPFASFVEGEDVCGLQECYDRMLNNQTCSEMERIYLTCANVGLTSRFLSSKFAWHQASSLKKSALLHRKDVQQHLPKEWTVCTLYLSPDQQLWLCRTERDFEFLYQVDTPRISALLHEFAALMQANRDTLDQCTVEFATTQSKRAKDKWWKERFELEDRLTQWHTQFEQEVFADWRRVLVRGSLEGFPDDILGRFVTSKKEEHLIRMCLSSGLDPDSIHRALIHFCPSLHANEVMDAIPELAMSGKRNPVLLCLSGALQQVSFESLPVFQDQLVSRISSLPCALDHGKWTPRTGLLSYIVDPNDELKRTQNALREELNDLTRLGLCNAEGILGTGTENVSQVFERCLLTSSLVMYCGHGSGEQFVDPRRVVDQTSEWSPVFLIGCSSAGRAPCGVFEPNGKVIDAYQNRCPLVVGTLWNVSDVDIDRFTVDMLHALKGGEKNLLRLVSQSRKACKLRMLVGAAPVCFGIPWTLL